MVVEFVAILVVDQLSSVVRFVRPVEYLIALMSALPSPKRTSFFTGLLGFNLDLLLIVYPGSNP